MHRRAAARAVRAARRPRAPRCAIASTSWSGPRCMTPIAVIADVRGAARESGMHGDRATRGRESARRGSRRARRRPTCRRRARACGRCGTWRRTLRICAATIAASPWPSAVRRSNQFQQRHGFAESFCRRQQHDAAGAVGELRDARALRDLFGRLLAAVAQHEQRRAPPARAALRARRRDSRGSATRTARCRASRAAENFDPVSKRPGAGSRRNQPGEPRP